MRACLNCINSSAIHGYGWTWTDDGHLLMFIKGSDMARHMREETKLSRSVVREDWMFERTENASSREDWMWDDGKTLGG